MNKRVFLAINLPKETKKEIFELFCSALSQKEFKIVEEENLHITLLFLGYLNEDAIEKLKEKMNSLRKFKQFNAVIGGIGNFNLRVLWVRVREGAKEIEEIAKKLVELVGVKEEERFHAHITVARTRKEADRKKVKEKLSELEKIKFEETVWIKSIDLMESVLSPKGPKYSLIYSAELKKN